MREIFLSNNKISGTIPDEFASDDIETLDLSGFVVVVGGGGGGGGSGGGGGGGGGGVVVVGLSGV